MLTIARLGAGGRSAEYYLERSAGCEADYYLEGSHRGRWELAGSRALGLTGSLDDAGDGAFRGLLDGYGPDGTRLVAPVLRADPRGRLPARVLVETITAQADNRGVSVRELLADDRLGTVFEQAAGQVEVDRHLPRRPRAALPADVAGTLAAAARLDPAALFATAEDPDRYACALQHLGERVDVRRAGLDLTFSAPKSVSVLFGLADAEVAAQVRAAHAEAVRQTMDYLQTQAARVVRGHVAAGQPTTYLGTDGLVGASFEHASSRAGDPQLHTHVVVANLARGTDGRWSAIDTATLYRQAQTGGYLYQAVLRGELTRRLGVSWGPVRRGVAEIEGIGPPLRRVFSQRRAQIDAELARTGRSGPKAAQVAAWRSRDRKHDETELTARQRWAARAREAGTDPGRLVTSVLRRSVHLPLTPQRGQPADRTTLSDLTAQVTARVLGVRGVTARQSTFDRRELLRAVCEVAPAGTPLTVSDLRELATAVLRSGEVVPLVGEAPGDRRYSTAGLLAVEQAALARAGSRLSDGAACLPSEVVDRHLASTALTVEQATAVRRLLTSDAGVMVLHGPAGAGKTAALAVAREICVAQGIPIRGVAVAAIAAQNLTEGAGIGACTVTQLARRLHRRPDGRHANTEPVLPFDGLLIVDEAGMLGTRQLAQINEACAQSRTKLVLVGDPYQLPEIDAGGLFAALADVVPIAALTGNVRQREPWERAALGDLRNGDVLAGLGAYQQAGRVHIGQQIPALREQMVSDYLTARESLPDGEVLMLAVRRADVRALNAAVRTRLLADGRLGPDRLVVAGGDRSPREFRAGDRVVVTANDYLAGLVNGLRGEVTSIAGDGRGLQLRLRGGRLLSVSTDALCTGALEHGYALTVHRAQGVTVDVALLFASQALTREAGYVAMSRGRECNALYTTWDAMSPDQPDDDISIRAVDPVRNAERSELTDAALVARFETRRAQRLAISQLDPSRARRSHERHRSAAERDSRLHGRGA